MKFPLQILGVVFLAVGPGGIFAADFAESRYVDLWLRHPVYGDPSFDAFERVPGNPIHRGAPPYEWPVNGFMFHDPVSGNDYIYVGDYALGYWPKPVRSTSNRCILYRSADGMKSWTNLGVVMQGDRAMFDKGGNTPDVSVVFDAGRYHMVYDWRSRENHQEGGLAYAWADKPEGPWHRAPEPITRSTTMPKVSGRYQFSYGGTLVRRKHDWLIVSAILDEPPRRWAQAVMTAPSPAGPWSERRLVEHLESDNFYPPLIEFYPAFTKDGYLYAPAYSIARNRDFNVLFRAPVERADDPAAWEIARYGSLWHSEDVENEYVGMWGQTFSGLVDARGTFWAMFPSLDKRNLGTINLARRPWNQPMRPRGFVLGGHTGPGFTCLRQTYRDFALEANFQVSGTALLVWDWHGALGPTRPDCGTTLNSLARRSFDGIELSPTNWAVVRVDEDGRMERLASGVATNHGTWELKLYRRPNGEVQISAAGRELWTGMLAPSSTETNPGAIGWWVETKARLAVDKFQIKGKAMPVRINYLGTEALAGAGEDLDHWTESRSPDFHLGAGLISREQDERVKWNVTGRQLTLWSPRGPDFGKVRILLDGKPAAEVNLQSDHGIKSQPIWTSKKLRGQYHGLVCQSLDGALPVDCLEVEE